MQTNADFDDSDFNKADRQPTDPVDGASTSGTSLPADIAAQVDALLEDGFKRPANLNALKAHPVGAVISRLALLDLGLPPTGLLARTLQAISKQAHRAIPLMRTKRKYTVPTGFNQRAVDLWVMAVAASVLVVVVFFSISQARIHALRFACARNLQAVGSAMEQYAANNSNRLPEIAPPADRNWLPRDVVTDVPRSADAHSNLANLSPLVDGAARYTSWERLVCPATPISARGLNTERCPQWGSTGYSYIDQLGPYHHHWLESDTVPVMADANPIVYEPYCCNVSINSVNHGGAGQNVLFNTGSVIWETTADVGPGHHNIWTVGEPPVVQYNGTEEPRHRYRAFLVP